MRGWPRPSWPPASTDPGARLLGREDEQTLTAALDNPDGDALYRRPATQAQVEEEQRRAAEREAQRPVCTRCRAKFTDQRWEETTTPGYAWEVGKPVHVPQLLRRLPRRQGSCR
ncbi:hypothetical protein [Streptomyces sp. LN590]|uniref:hypothetical protein n=1 Tax=unclassified Streptomyces TaxID=2593676 RepID=UPI0037164E58